MIVETYEDIVILSGSLQMNNWETIQTAISLILKRHPSGVIIDCSGLTGMSPEGALTFQDAFDYVSHHDEARVVLAAVPPAVQKVLRDTPEVRSQLPIVATVEEARRSLDALSALEQSKSKAKVKKDAKFSILCVLEGAETDLDVLVMTREIVNNISAKVVILLPILVPRNLPLTAPMPNIEEKAALSAAKAQDILVDLRTPSVVRMERTRDLAALLQEQSEEIKASYTVLAIPMEREGEERCSKLMKSVLEKVKRPIVFVRGHDTVLE
jgi:anti-anti-sigma regulatory factor